MTYYSCMYLIAASQHNLIIIIPDSQCASLTVLCARYHIKYMHIGDREEIEKVITTLHVPLKLRLKFLCPSLSDPAQTPGHAQFVVPTS